MTPQHDIDNGIQLRVSPDITPEQYATSLKVLHDLWANLGPNDGLKFDKIELLDAAIACSGD